MRRPRRRPLPRARRWWVDRADGQVILIGVLERCDWPGRARRTRACSRRRTARVTARRCRPSPPAAPVPNGRGSSSPPRSAQHAPDLPRPRWPASAVSCVAIVDPVTHRARRRLVPTARPPRRRLRSGISFVGRRDPTPPREPPAPGDRADDRAEPRPVARGERSGALDTFELGYRLVVDPDGMTGDCRVSRYNNVRTRRAFRRRRAEGESKLARDDMREQVRRGRAV